MSTLAEILRVGAARIISNADAENYVGGAPNLRELVEGFHLKPARKNGKVTQWDIKTLDTALDRAAREGWPKPAHPKPTDSEPESRAA